MTLNAEGWASEHHQRRFGPTIHDNRSRRKRLPENITSDVFSQQFDTSAKWLVESITNDVLG